jgi:hypothetical protein
MANSDKQPKKTWSEIIGVKDSCRVRVFERRPGGNLHVEWQNSEGKRHPEALRINGRPVRDRKIAIRIALAISQALLSNNHDRVLSALGIKPPRTLGQLLEELHTKRERTWKTSYRKQQIRFRREWLKWLGPNRLLSDINAAMVEDELAKQTEVEAWGPRTRNGRARYLVDAFYFAQLKLKWIVEDGNLSAVDFLALDQIGLEYEEWELDLLREIVDEIDLRLSASFRIADDTGRRIQAITQLRVENVSIETVWTDTAGEITLMRLTFPGEVEKKGKTSWSYVTPDTRVVIEHLMAMPAVQASGYIFPNRQRLTVRPAKNEAAEIRPAQPEDLIELLHHAEALTQQRARENGTDKFVKWKKGRTFHGIKRASVTIQGAEARNLEIAAKQSGTSVQMLQQRYHQQSREDVAEMVHSMDKRRKRRAARRTAG